MAYLTLRPWGETFFLIWQPKPVTVNHVFLLLFSLRPFFFVFFPTSLSVSEISFESNLFFHSGTISGL